VTFQRVTADSNKKFFPSLGSSPNASGLSRERTAAGAG
jgi:hypothetical protein